VKISMPGKVPLFLKDPLHWGHALRALRVALAFLTVIPVRFRAGEPTPADMAAARYAFPVIGVAIGLALALLSLGLGAAGAAPLLSSFLLVATWGLISGGLHLDGLADTGDGLFLSGDADRRLSAMRDPHVGSFGLLAVVLVVLGKFAALAPMLGRRRALAVLGAAAIGRTLILVAAGLAPYARPEGTGRNTVASTTVVDALWSIVAVLALGALLAGEFGLLASAAALLVTWALTQHAQRQIGGVTGDILGAVVELGELAYLVILGFMP
jgi:adenosylcobinamide-GDP ribazoletransferase